MLIIYWVYQNHNERMLQSHLHYVNTTVTNYNAIVNGIERSSTIIFETLNKNKQVLELMKTASTSYGDDKDKAREALYDLLADEYKILQKNGYRQLHFHLPNGESFLRFHRPNKYGDNLKALRYSISAVNSELKPYMGFEEGRIFNGYRFVFPLIENKAHYGSVEISVSFKAIANELIKLNNIKTGIVFSKKIVQAKVFEEELENYQSCEQISSILFDKQLTMNKVHGNSYSFFKTQINQNPKKIEQCINANSNTWFDVNWENENYTIIFHPVPNIQGERLGSMFVAYKNKEVEKLLSNFLYKTILVIALYILTMIILYIAIFRTKQLYIANNRLKKSSENLEEANDVKNKLFEVITHDLRNHFNAVNGFTELLNKRNTENDEKLSRLINGLADTTHLTNSLMDNLFIWSRIQINKVEFKRELFEASKWFEKEINRFKSITDRKQLQIINKTTTPVYVNGDKDMMVYIVRNTFHNAIKYSKKGESITVELSDNLVDSTLIIQDTGKGMTASEVNEIMTKDNWSGSKLKHDIGLGLYNTKKLIDYHKGKLTIESTLGVGTTIKITIPKK